MPLKAGSTESVQPQAVAGRVHTRWFRVRSWFSPWEVNARNGSARGLGARSATRGTNEKHRSRVIPWRRWKKQLRGPGSYSTIRSCLYPGEESMTLRQVAEVASSNFCNQGRCGVQPPQRPNSSCQHRYSDGFCESPRIVLISHCAAMIPVNSLPHLYACSKLCSAWDNADSRYRGSTCAQFQFAYA